jgi:two-component system sensor kinase FixL
MNGVSTLAIPGTSDRTALLDCEARAEGLQQQVDDLSAVAVIRTTTNMIVHEVTQPVTAAANYLAVAERLLSHDDTASTEYALEAVKQAQLCLVRTGDVMGSVKDVAARKPFDPQPLELAEIVGDVMQMFTDRSDITPVIEISPTAGHAMGDAVQIGQVLSNLVRNAMEATEGQSTRHLRITSRRSDDAFIEVRVEDNGPGVSRQRKRRLFTAFASTKAKGSGIGLSICRTIIKQHRGRIWADALPDGTALCFTLPAC